MTDSTRVLLVSTYDLGHQPFGLASPAAWLTAAGHRVDCLDLSRCPLDPALVAGASAIAFHIPMHTATRLAIDAYAAVRAINPSARICFYGLYGQANADHLTALGADAVISGEYEAELLAWVSDVAIPVRRRLTVLDKLDFVVPDRAGLPPLADYAQLKLGQDCRVVGYTEATRGCRHLCRHCPVAPVYGGRVRVVQREVVLADIEAQVEAGAEHITFGDPDFFNASAHAVRVITELHERWPQLTYDVTIKVEHLLRHATLLPRLAATGCLFVTSAVESVDDTVLAILDKGHTRAEFIASVAACRAAGVVMNPTFVAFHPWLTRADLLDTFDVLNDLDLPASLAPIQLTTRLLVPEGSLLLGMPELAHLWQPLDQDRLVHPWTHPDPEMDCLQREFEAEVAEAGRNGAGRYTTFDRLWRLAGGHPLPRATQNEAVIPQFMEPWFCCSEPVGELVTGWTIPETQEVIAAG
jgi:radical SAM superfamily enzyme YgiQ (UPF0313 family)